MIFYYFCNLYNQRHPGRVSELVQYMFVIRDAARKFPGMGWRNYDEQFRLRQAISYQNWLTLIIPALSKESSGILLLPLSVRMKSLSLQLRLHFKDLRNDTLGSRWACLIDAQQGFKIFIFKGSFVT